MRDPAKDRITRRIKDLKDERDILLAYPVAELIAIIQDVGFSCTSCGRCCTREFNDHVCLLDNDTVRVQAVNPEALIPAPHFAFCDQNGVLYTSGYTLRTNDDGGCYFLDPDRRCTIYPHRMGICRIYPYMLHREEGEDGTIDWRQISGLNQHGDYHVEITHDEAEGIANMVKAYEEAYLNQEIAFLECLHNHFIKEQKRHIQKRFDRQMAAFQKGELVPVKIYYKGTFEDGIADCRESGIKPKSPGKR